MLDKKWGLSALVLFLATPVWAQEEDAKTILKKGLETSAQGGGLKLEGEVKNESPFAGMGFQLGGMEGGGLSGKFTGLVGANGTLLVKVENDKGSYELFQKKDKIVQRQTWTGTQVQAGAFPHEVSSFLAFAALAKGVDKAKDLKKCDSAKVGDVECLVIKGQLPIGVVSEESDEGQNQFGFKFKMWELKKVEATFYIGKEDHLMRKIEAKLTRGMSSMIRMNMPGGGGGKDEDDDGDENDDNNGQPGPGNWGKMKTTSTYTYTVTGYDKDLEVKVPDEVKKYFQE